MVNNTCQALGLDGMLKSHGKKKLVVEEENVSISFIMPSFHLACSTLNVKKYSALKHHLACQIDQFFL